MWFYILYLVLLVAAIALAPKPPQPAAGTIADFSLPTAQEDRPIPVVFGTVEVTGPNVVWYGHLQSIPIKAHSFFSSTVVAYKYYLGMQLALCHGPIDEFSRILWGKRLFWAGSVTQTTYNIFMDQRNLFGGEQRAGGIYGFFDVIVGGDSELLDPYLVSELGNEIPAYRGIAQWVWQSGDFTDPGNIDSGYIGTQTTVQPVQFKITRILKGWGLGGVWYPETARVTTVTNSLNGAPNWTPSFTSALGADFPAGANTLTFISGDANFQQGMTGYIFLQSGLNSKWVSFTTTDFPDGSLSPVLDVSGPLFGTTDAFFPNGTQLAVFLIDTGPVVNMNPAHIIYQCLTNPDWGLGLSPQMIDDASFRAAALTFFTEGMGLSMQWVQASTVQDFIQIVLNHCAAMLCMRNDLGIYQLLPIRGGYNVFTLPLFDETNVKSLDEFTKQGWADVVNQVVLVYTDPATGNTTAITGQDSANINIQGKVISTTLHYEGIKDHALAPVVLGRELLARTTPLTKIKITVNRSAWNIGYGTLFRFAWADRNAGQTGTVAADLIAFNVVSNSQFSLSGDISEVASSYTNAILTGVTGANAGLSEKIQVAGATTTGSPFYRPAIEVVLFAPFPNTVASSDTFTITFDNNGLIMRIVSMTQGTLDQNDMVIEALEDIYSLTPANYLVNGTGILNYETAQSTVATTTGGPTVISSTTTTPPTNPQEGDRYLVPTNGTGAWAACAGEIAVWDDTGGVSGKGGWVCVVVPPGAPIYVTDTGNYETVINNVIQPPSFTTAEGISYDNTTSGLTATDVQEAIDELAALVGVTYDVGVWIEGKPGVSEYCASWLFDRQITMPAGLSGSYAYCDVAPTASYQFTLYHIVAGVHTSIGTVNFAASTQTATFTFTANVVFAPGDLMAVYGAATMDTTLANTTMMFKGNRN